ncbi:MAG TPA: pilus assembly protein TadG-related protein [Dehalococcoidia bacterium]|nr:pilus assembly protein TadG-related protein [Dehalococcoidia bacterium]
MYDDVRPQILRREAGQSLILLVLAMTVVFVIGAFVVDMGLWLSERRGAQTDSDAAVLAGAQALLKDSSDTTGAFNDAVAWAVKNGIDPAKVDSTSTTSCSAGNSCVATGSSNCREGVGGTDTMPWVEARIRHPAAALFSSIFTNAGPDIGAIARACVGSPRSQNQLSPFGVQTGSIPPVGDPEVAGQCLNDLDDDSDGTVNDGCPISDCLEPDPADPSKTRPVYGAVCILKTSGQTSVNGQRGQLTIGEADCSQTSNNTLEHDFHYGTNAYCQLGQQVTTGTGVINGLLKGLNDRLLEEGKCDQLFGTGHASYDDFNEVFSMPGSHPGDVIVPSATNVFSVNDCYVTTGIDVPPDRYDGDVHTFVPRALDLVLIDRLQPTNETHGTATITGFAGFYVVGCYRDSNAVSIKQQIETNLANMGSFLNRCDHPTGQDDVLGIFVKKLAPPEQVSDPDPRLPLSIVLVK